LEVKRIMAEKALQGVRVVELAKFVSGPYCAKLLADLGAEVVKIEESLIGDEARRRGPFLIDVPHPERSGLFLYLNTNKLGITLNIETETGRELFKQLVNRADILIEDNPPRVMPELGLDYENLRAINPRLIMTSITPFGQTGPHRDYKAYHLNSFHAGGEPHIMFDNSVTADRAPVKGPGLIGDYDCGLSAAAATLAALYARGATGLGQHVDISKQESAIALDRVDNLLYPNRHKSETKETIRSHAQGRGMIGGLMRCKDGYVMLAAVQDNQWRGLVDLMGHPEWTMDDRVRDERSRTLQAREITSQVQQWMMDKTTDEVFRGGQERGVPVGKVNSPQDVVNSPQLRWREFFVKIEHPETGKIEYPTAPYRLSETPWAADRPAPLLGQHNEEIYCQLLGYARQDLATMRENGVI
jgi:crotonobetainyl-CoA:carnitine CoA-transferase CaiB-like acyl-CoA transferase